MMKNFSWRVKGDFIAVVDNNVLTIICTHAYHTDQDEGAVTDELVKEFRNVPHVYLSDIVVQFLVSEGNAQSVLADMAGGAERVNDLRSPFSIE